LKTQIANAGFQLLVNTSCQQVYNCLGLPTSCQPDRSLTTCRDRAGNFFQLVRLVEFSLNQIHHILKSTQTILFTSIFHKHQCYVKSDERTPFTMFAVSSVVRERTVAVILTLA